VKTKFGLGLIVLGIAAFAAWNWWTKTRNFVPVDVPVSLTAGQTVTSGFALNFAGLYLIELEAAKTMPLDTLHCLMAVEADAARCKDTPPAIGAAWTISRNGHVIGRGSSVELHSAPVQSGGVTRVMGEFQGRASPGYTLQVTFTADGGRLAVAHPRLKVTVADIATTDLQAASVLVLSVTFMCLLFGVILLVIAYFTRRGKMTSETSPAG
jgi:hypothetical protein